MRSREHSIPCWSLKAWSQVFTGCCAEETGTGTPWTILGGASPADWVLATAEWRLDHGAPGPLTETPDPGRDGMMPRLQDPQGQCPEVQVAHLRTGWLSCESKVALMEGTSGHPLETGVSTHLSWLFSSDWLIGGPSGAPHSHSIHREQWGTPEVSKSQDASCPWYHT